MKRRWSSDSSTKETMAASSSAARASAEQPRVVAAHGHLGVEVLEQVAGQAELREDDEVSALAAGLSDELVMALQVLLEGTEARRHLGQRDRMRFGRLMSPRPPCRVGAAPGR